MAAVEMLERGSVKAVSARSRCEGCPFAGGCTPCRPRTSGRVLVFESVQKLLKEKKLPEGIIYFSPVRQGSGESPIRTSEKTCSICRESVSTCLHSETSKK